jgi:hypothetical protein
MSRIPRIGLVLVLIGLGLAGCWVTRVVTRAPARDTTGITEGRCAPSAPAPTGRTGSGHGKLVPVAAREMVLCRYNGMNEAPYGKLRTARVVTDRATVDSWRSRFNALPAVSSGVRNCPMDDNRLLRIAFVASLSSYVVLTTDLAGCGFVSGPAGVREGGRASDTAFRPDLAQLAGS